MYIICLTSLIIDKIYKVKDKYFVHYFPNLYVYIVSFLKYRNLFILSMKKNLYSMQDYVDEDGDMSRRRTRRRRRRKIAKKTKRKKEDIEEKKLKKKIEEMKKNRLRTRRKKKKGYCMKNATRKI